MKKKAILVGITKSNKNGVITYSYEKVKSVKELVSRYKTWYITEKE